MLSYDHLHFKKLLVVNFTYNADKYKTDSIGETKANNVCHNIAFVGIIKRLMELTVIYRMLFYECYKALTKKTFI